MEILLMMVVLGLLMYLMMIRPQQKRMNEQRNMLNQLTPGTRVLLISRVFGTIRATGDTQVVVELAPGVEITCMKEAIMRVATDADEEFEYTDAVDVPTDEFVGTDPEDVGVEPVGVADETVHAESDPAPDAGQPQFVSDDAPADPSTKAAEDGR